ncbi:MAG: RAD55 family ATPase [Candidatus Syntropharchaeia archaeon]
MNGLDEMLGGGIPVGYMVTIVGPSEAGKTIATMQFTYENLKNGKKCLFVTASESPESITKNALSFGWDLREYIEKKQLLLVKSKLIDLTHYTSDFLERLPSTIQNSNADIVVVDSITEYNDICETDIERRGRLLHISEIIHVVQISKMRWTKHSREIRQYDITERGMEVYSKYSVLIGD